MCGRFALTVELDALMEAFPGFTLPQNLSPRYNIAPTQPVPVIPNDDEQQVKLFRWGLIPFWAKDPTIGNRMINARAETLAQKPSFKTAYQRRRCLVLTDGFYEWRKEAGRRTKTPYFIQLSSGKPFAFAGLWEVWKQEDSPIYSCTIITTKPNAVVAPIHNRMPVVLPPSAYDRWLDPDEHHTETLQPLLKPYPASDMVAYEVSTVVNNPSNDVPECVEPVAA
jgi:putative SOS response-associated peptidase YedK